MNVQRGMRDKLDKYVNSGQDIEVLMSVVGSAVYDYCCFGVDSAEKLSDDRYMIFYNQVQSPNGEIRFSSDGKWAKFTVNLNRLPQQIHKLVFTVSIDGSGTMRDISSHITSIRQSGQAVVDMNLSGNDFSSEKAIISIELYRKDVWRFAAVARGFNGGLGDLLRAYGGEEIVEEQPAAQNISGSGAQPAAGGNSPGIMGTPGKAAGTSGQNPMGNRPVSGTQTTTNQNSPLNMGRPGGTTGNRQQNPAVNAPVLGAQSASGQNSPLNMGRPGTPFLQGQQNVPPNGIGTGIQNGRPVGAGGQSVKVSLEKKLEREAPQLVSLAKPLAIELEKRNLQNCVARVALVLDISGSMSSRYNNGTVQEIVNKTLPLAVQFDDDGELDFWYYGSRPKRMDSINMKNYKKAVPSNWSELMKSLGYGNNEPLVMEEVLDEYKRSRIPAYVIFITDGGVGSEQKIKNLLIKASKEPIFWQFVGVGGSGYGILERLDNMGGRYVDNANFFALDDFKSVSNSELYSRLLNEFPQWLREIQQKGMI